jgi:hypothetical protein
MCQRPDSDDAVTLFAKKSSSVVVANEIESVVDDIPSFDEAMDEMKAVMERLGKCL